MRAIIFDIGRVLVRLDIAGAMGGLAGTISLTPQETWAAIEHDPRWRDWQEGRLSPRDWQLHICRRLGVTLTFEQFSEIWNRVLDPTPLLDGAFLENLSKRYCLAVLSNTDPIHVAELEKRFDFFRFFKHRIYSCVVGASKPSPLIFRAALQACKTTADNAVYIDDIPAYAEAARQLGMTGIVFQSPEQLAADLAQFAPTSKQKG
ncbi:MAG: glucose-phosphatase [Acidobacteriaceae bacterium]|jgi:HAD superfamily hydrolase (TIGR01509 family)|nr:glucose-phosphatase [Acidobacteriaceae bacterium]